MSRRLLLTLLWLLAITGMASAAPVEVQVRIGSLHPPAAVTLATEVGGRVLVGRDPLPWQPGRRLRLEATPDGVRATLGQAAPRVADAVTVRAADIRLDGRPYSGDITFRTPDRRTLYAIDRVALEAYVAGVVQAEALPGTPREALRAQAVAVRSYTVALAHADRPRDRPLGPHASEGYDFCDLTHCQAYKGVGGGSAAEATSATRGRLLYTGSRVVAAWYHSTCGGHTVDGATVGADPALRGVLDGSPAWCAASPHFRWTLDLSRGDLLRALHGDPETSPGRSLQAVRVTALESDGRAREVEIVGDRSVRVRGMDFWQVLGRAIGWGRMESAWFAIQTTQAGFHFEGRGLGHGAGMCQYGSIGMARAGRNMEQILHHYYGGMTLR